MTARSIMVLGCTSSAGKSLLVTALCRWFARNGVDVAPFKAQNMSNNARVVDGGEIGVAQWLQASAAGLEPTVAMNPVLLKPEGDTRSQVVVRGRPRPDLTTVPWRERGPYLWTEMLDAHTELAAEHELIIIEGAGSPAEINLPDLVNKGILEATAADALLVVDIDRGGAFAHLVGTWELLPSELRRQVRGYVLNKFRGDASLLEPGPSMVTERTGMVHAGTVPMSAHELPDEEGGSVRVGPPPGAPTVAIVRYPFSSNLDEWHLLPHVAHVRWATEPADVFGVDTVILPGSKHVAADRDWLRARGLDRAVIDAAMGGTRVIGVCGGCMLLGDGVEDPAGIEGACDGLSLLPLTTKMAEEKTTARSIVHFADDLPTPWSRLAGVRVDGYEIRHGEVTPTGPASLATTGTGTPVWVVDGVMGTTAHGLFEHPDVLAATFGTRPPPVLARTFDDLADLVDRHLDIALLESMATGGR